MPFTAILRKSGGSIILSIPKSIAQSLAIEAGSAVELSVDGRKLSVVPARRSLVDRLAASPRTPADWHRDDGLDDAPTGRELL
ncbi:AbrB/MazE/SpoVT family DNA-binding domain-containing protein [Lysobacter sp. D1-1-M9]